ncbi:hypothetical protein BN1708_018756, partial [Verticillium longisporum]
RPPRARHEARPRPRRQPHERPARVVQAVALLQGQPLPPLVHLAARPLRRRRHPPPAQQLGRPLPGQRLGVGRAHAGVLPAPLLHRAARPQLGEPGRARRRPRHHALLARPRRRRLPPRRHQLYQQGPGLPRLGPHRPPRRRALRRRAPPARVPCRARRHPPRVRRL